VTHNPQNITFLQSQRAKGLGTDIGQNRFIHRILEEILRITFTLVWANAGLQEEVEPVIFGPLHRGTRGALGIGGGSSPNTGQGLVLIQRDTSSLLHILQILNGHLGDWNCNLDSIGLMEMNLSILETNKLRFNGKGFSPVRPFSHFV
jgi:hypothetical protein